MGKIETQREAGRGNTKLSPQCTQKIYWFFTFNNYTNDDIILLETRFKEICKKYIFQEEVGESGTPHLQGCIVLKKRMRWTEFKLPKQIHWEVTISHSDAENYCQKLDTAVGKIYRFGYPPKLKVIDKLTDWQKEIEDIIFTEPDGRTVHWFYDTSGNMGKSAFSRYMYIKHGVLPIRGGKLADIINIIYKFDTDNMKMLIVDIPRDNENDICYSALECILDGMITNTKFETGVKVFNPPHVVVMCNFPPEYDRLSHDRWNVRHLNK